MLVTLRPAAVAAAVLFTPALAHADPIEVLGGDTRVQVTLDLGSLTPGVTGGATVVSTDPLTVNIPITGGDLDPDTFAGSINHFASTVTLSNGVNTVGISDLRIDLTNALVIANVELNFDLVLGAASVFSFDPADVSLPGLFDLDNPSLPLVIRAPLAEQLTLAFGLPDLTGVEFGLAATAPDPVAAVPTPAPAALALFGLSTLGLAAARRRRA